MTPMSSAHPQRLMFVFGTRPEAIKMAPIILRARQIPSLDVQVCTTGQHREMLAQVLQLFGIEPNVDLQLMRAGQDLASLTATALTACHEVFERERPDLVLVHGDTTTTLAASLAAYYSKLPVAHVEAGLRTSNIYSPWPEELNRKLVADVASLHFAPTEQARTNLLAEGVTPGRVFVTGNTVIDALRLASERLEQDTVLTADIDATLPPIAAHRRLVLVTGHRRENFGAGFIGICNALRRIADRGDVEIVYPVHLNPSVQGIVHDMLGGHDRIHLIAPQDYLPFVRLLTRCHFVLTDSGGIQEEAPALGKPVLVMRDTTERPEAISAGTARLVGTDPEKIVLEAYRLLDDPIAYDHMAQAHNPYGDGQSSARILELLQRQGNV